MWDIDNTRFALSGRHFVQTLGIFAGPFPRPPRHVILPPGVGGSTSCSLTAKALYARWTMPWSTQETNVHSAGDLVMIPLPGWSFRHARVGMFCCQSKYITCMCPFFDSPEAGLTFPSS